MITCDRCNMRNLCYKESTISDTSDVIVLQVKAFNYINGINVNVSINVGISVATLMNINLMDIKLMTIKLMSIKNPCYIFFLNYLKISY